MAPAASKKGAKASAARDRRSSSRQSTPLSTPGDNTAPPTPLAGTPTTSAPAAATTPTPSLPKETAYIHTATASLVSTDPSIEALIDKFAGANPPPAKDLHILHDRIRDGVLKVANKRSEVCDRSMRQLVQKRKERVQQEQEREMEEQAAKVKEEEGEQRRKKKEKVGKKRSAEEIMEGVEVQGGEAGEGSGGKGERRDSLPSVGAHGVARQDGVGLHEGAPAPPSPVIVPKHDTADLMDVADSGSESDTSLKSAPTSTAPLYERAFGKDPTLFDDPTVYDIKALTDDMTDDEKRAILNVMEWPDNDLKDLTAGDPPDMDFYNATKPTNQVHFGTFQTYVEPYIRPFTEEDVAYLKERADRTTPYLIPQRGTRTYKEVWAAEDGNDGIAPPRKQEANPNEARGSMEDMNTDTAETDEVSMGPIMNRLMSIFRPAPSMKKDSGANKDEDAEGDVSMLDGDDQDQQTSAGATTDELTANYKPATYLPPDAPRPPNLVPSDYISLDQRALQELRHIGFLAPNDAPDFAAHTDDEVSARLRTLQHELRRVSRANNVRKLRVLELTEERMAMQEYANIADDLDNQVNAAYLKRNRSLAKPGSKKGGSSGAARPRAQANGIATAGLGGRGVSEGVRALMQKRRDWIEMVGPVVGYGRPPIPGEGETVFDEGNLRRLERVEREAEAGEVGEGE
ncbi:Transcriptional regulator [Extremus antarcticus]|uniref:Transcriptional regulator n=1 Tax=Extremus antarcticus TaxID=702011 RepID=A0AAJ0DGC7_9PEZI|nr:Transcriptional regulator [Extremus antarcticus]